MYKLSTGSDYKIPFQDTKYSIDFLFFIRGQEILNLTRVKIWPTGVESKNNMGALKTALVNPEKKALEAFNPR